MDIQLKKHIEEVKLDGLSLKDIPIEYRSNKQVVKAAIVRKYNQYYSDDKLYTVQMFDVLEAFNYADESLRNDKKFVLKLIEKCSGYLFRYLPENLKNDEDVFLQAITRTGKSYVYSELTKCENKKFSIDDDLYTLGLDDYLLHNVITQYAGVNVKANKILMLEAVKYEPGALIYLNNNLTYDKDIVSIAVSGWGFCLSYASERLRDDKEVVLAAIYASCNEHFWWDIVNEEYWSEPIHPEWRDISDRLLNDKDIYLEIINDPKKYFMGEYVLNLAPDSIKNNEEVVLAAIKKNKNALKFASENLQQKFIDF